MAIKHRIDEIYTAHPFYGSRKLTVVLAEAFGPINRKRVQRYMREMGIAAIAPGPNLSKRASDHRIYPYLLRNLTAQRPDHIWGCDITYVRLRHGWLYLVAILDWYSRYVVSWALDETLELPFVLDALHQALATATPVIWNTDQAPKPQNPGNMNLKFDKSLLLLRPKPSKENKRQDAYKDQKKETRTNNDAFQ